MDAGSNLWERVKHLFSEEGDDEIKLNAEELEMIRNILKFKEKDAKDIMTHRKNIIALDGQSTVEEALKFIVEENNSRFPIYEEDIDTIIGIIHLRDAMKCYFDETLRGKTIKDLKQYIRPVSFIPETKSIDKLFKKMKAEKNHMVIVLDEYGQTSGLVAMEDILEEIVGNILDEYDKEEVHIVKQKDGSFLADGMTEIAELEKAFHFTFEEDDYETLNGFMIYQLEHIPSEDEKCEVIYQGYKLQVETVEDNIIHRVKIVAL